MLILTIKNTAAPVGLQNAMKSNVSLVLIKGFFKWIRRKQTTFFPYSNAQLCIVESIQTLNFSLGILSKVSFWPLHCSLIKFEFILFISLPFTKIIKLRSCLKMKESQMRCFQLLFEKLEQLLKVTWPV